jgi:hypothetical protein
MRTPAINPALWFMHLGCTGKHYLLGNPHTVPGRIWAWCPREGCSHFVSFGDMGRMSSASSYWVAGYLSGNQPPPPSGPDGPPDFGSPEYKRWQAKVRRFNKTGAWPRAR